VEEVAIATLAMKVEVAKKTTLDEATKVEKWGHGLPGCNLYKLFYAKVCFSCRVYLDDYHVKWSTQKKSKATMTIIDKLLHNFKGNYNVHVVLQCIGNAQHQWHKSFLKVTKENWKHSNLCSKANYVFFKNNWSIVLIF
jgi:hypothetical protein